MTWSNPVVSLAETEALALEIAEAIATGGVSLLAAPTLLYDNSQPAPVGTPGLVGATVSNNWFPAGTSEAHAITQFNSWVGLPLGNQVQRIYYGLGKYPALTDQPLAACIAAGAKVQICLKPLITGLTNATIATSEQNNIASTITLLQNAGVVFDLVFWTEANIGGKFTGPSQYIALIALYGPTVINAGVNLIYNPASYGNNFALWYPGDALTSKVSIDYYTSDFNAGITFDSCAALADNHLPDPIDFGVSEINISPNGTQPQYVSMTNYVINYMSNRLASGLNNGDIIFYAGFNATTSQQILSSADPKIPQLVAIYNDLSSSPPSNPGLIINGGGTQIIPAIVPSPGGSYAMANGFSYDITLTLTANAAGSTNPFVTVQCNWINVDSPGAVPVAIQHWNLPIGTTGGSGTVTIGYGQQHGQYLQIKIVNRDTVACTAVAQINSTSRSVTGHNWYWESIASGGVPGFTISSIGASYANSLISISGVSIPAASGGNPGSKSYLMSMFAGPVSVSATTNGASSLQFLIIPQPVSILGGGAVYDETTASDARIIYLPRAPCLLVINNANNSAVDAYAEVILNG
jgi:hypothetical protein